jgi:hypothetical protein
VDASISNRSVCSANYSVRLLLEHLVGPQAPYMLMRFTRGPDTVVLNTTSLF